VVVVDKVVVVIQSGSAFFSQSGSHIPSCIKSQYPSADPEGQSSGLLI